MRFAFFVGLVAIVNGADARPWKNHSGKEIEAEFVSADDTIVTLMKDNETIRFKIELLCEEDQQHIRELRKGNATSVNAEETKADNRIENPSATSPTAKPTVKGTGFLKEKTLDNYIGLTLPDGTVVTTDMIRQLTPEQRFHLFPFSNFPEKSRIDILSNSFERRKKEREALDKLKSEGKSLEPYIDLTLDDGRVVTAEMLSELSESTQARLMSSSQSAKEGRKQVLERYLKFAEDIQQRYEERVAADKLREAEPKPQSTDNPAGVPPERGIPFQVPSFSGFSEQQQRLAEERRKRNDESRLREQAKQDAEQAQRNAKVLAEVERKNLEQQERNRQREAEEIKNQQLRAEQEANKERERAAEKLRRAEAEAADVRRINEQNERLAQRESAQPVASAPTRVNKNDKSQSNRDKYFNPYVTESIHSRSTEDFRREHGMSPLPGGGGQSSSNDRIRISGRAIKGVIFLAIFLLGGAITILRKMFSSSTSETMYDSRFPSSQVPPQNWS